MSVSSALSTVTGSVTVHLYRPNRTPVASACVPHGDVSHMTLDLARQIGIKTAYVGVSERRSSCGDPKLASRERAGRPAADRHYSGIFEPTKGRGTMVYRYPADFGGRGRPSCSRTGG